MTHEERDLLIKIDTRLGSLIEILDRHITSDEQRFEKQDVRIAFLEKTTWIGIGGLMILQMVLKLWR